MAARASSAILKNARPANLYSLSDELAQKYLRRLRIHAPPPITTAGLSSLVKAHTSRIPWGNLDIHMGILPPHKFEAAAPPSNVCALLPIEDLTERLLQRGGYCFQSAPPFCALLRHLGFDADLYRAQVVNHTELPGAARPNHAAVVVRNLADRDPEEVVLADVAIGDGPRCAVPLRDGAVAHEPPFTYTIEPLPAGHADGDGLGWWRFRHDRRGGFSHFDIDLTSPATAFVGDFVPSHHRLSNDPQSGMFARTFIMQRAGESGDGGARFAAPCEAALDGGGGGSDHDHDHDRAACVETIKNRAYRVLDRFGMTETWIESEEQLAHLLFERFGVELARVERAALWRSVERLDAESRRRRAS